jgi:aromatic-L-amino-acid decarboxylase
VAQVTATAPLLSDDEAARRAGVAASFHTAVDTLLRIRAARADLPPAPADRPSPPATALAGLAVAEGPGNLDEALRRVEAAALADARILPHRQFGHVPSGAGELGVMGELLAAGINPFTGVAAESPILAAWERQLIADLAARFGLPAGAGGLLTSGASSGVVHALAAARHALPPRQWPRAVVYVAPGAHHSVYMAARTVGISRVRLLPVDERGRLDLAAARALVARDRLARLAPAAVVVTAGTTDTGAVDDLAGAAHLAHGGRRRMWLHVDGALAGMWYWTPRVRALMDGLEQADSLCVDPHKALSTHNGNSVLLVGDLEALRAAFRTDPGPYMPARPVDGPPDFAELGIELTRPYRGLALLLPLYVAGWEGTVDYLDRRLDLTESAYQRLSWIDGFEMLGPPQTVVVAWRLAGGDRATHDRFVAACARRGVGVSATVVHGRPALRMCLTCHLAGASDVLDAVDVCKAAAEEVAACGS